MVGLIVIGVFIAFIFFVSKAARSNQSMAAGGSNANASLPAYRGDTNALLKKGTPALGIILNVANYASKSSRFGIALESRSMTIDIEVPGAKPYSVQASVDYPVNLRNDVLPGATVELRVDPKSPRRNIVIVGPGVAFSAQLAQSPKPT